MRQSFPVMVAEVAQQPSKHATMSNSSYSSFLKGWILSSMQLVLTALPPTAQRAVFSNDPVPLNPCRATPLDSSCSGHGQTAVIRTMHKRFSSAIALSI